MTCGPPGSSTVGAPGATSIASSTRRIFATPPSMMCVCSSTFVATGVEPPVQPVERGALGLEGHVSGAVRRVAQRGAHPRFLVAMSPTLATSAAEAATASPIPATTSATITPRCSSPVGPRRLRLALKRPAMPAVANLPPSGRRASRMAEGRLHAGRAVWSLSRCRVTICRPAFNPPRVRAKSVTGITGPLQSRCSGCRETVSPGAVVGSGRSADGPDNRAPPLCARPPDRGDAARPRRAPRARHLAARAAGDGRDLIATREAQLATPAASLPATASDGGHGISARRSCRASSATTSSGCSGWPRSTAASAMMCSRLWSGRTASPC